MPNPTLSTPTRAAPRRTLWLAFALLALALVRGVLMLAAQPLVALANNYDQVRYTGCFDLYPVRPGVDPTSNNYQAPLETYAFQPVPSPICYWTSDLAFQGLAAAAFAAHEAVGGDANHSVRQLGMLRLAAWLAAVALVSLAFVREGYAHVAIANLAWFALLGLDPVNSLYLNTFYSEAGALFFAYLTIALTALAAVRATPLRLVLVALAAFALGFSKMQHLALPLAVGGAVAFAAFVRAPALWRPALALAAGGALALGVQFAQMHRGGPMFGSIETANNLDFALTALLPASDDAARTAQRVGLGAECAAHRGKSIYTVGAPPEAACPGVGALSRARALGLAFSEPMTLVRLVAAIPRDLLPWIPHYLGTVAGAQVAPLPDGFVTVDRWLGRRAAFAWLLLALPVAFAAVLLARRRSSPLALAFACACAAVALAVPVVSMFGDGLVELAKHSHLALNAACAAVLGFGVGALVRRAAI
ncbi:hypothetical protein [Tahibacter soli]|uniref:Uncharacterized protein n=1 Tax=Tahibacter soli TaxID=2983605 RepID=A0A9X4BGV2_9GAMM|nr:hypothetical protein [Tahibacter soli]MDC8013320.1 hypothetical protein [Tahibacter soli]